MNNGTRVRHTQGNPAGEEPNVSAVAVLGRPWNLVLSASPGQHPENTGARLSLLGSGSSPSNSEPTDEARTSAPAPTLHPSRPAKARHVRSQRHRAQ